MSGYPERPFCVQTHQFITQERDSVSAASSEAVTCVAEWGVGGVTWVCTYVTERGVGGVTWGCTYVTERGVGGVRWGCTYVTEPHESCAFTRTLKPLKWITTKLWQMLTSCGFKILG